MTYQLFYADRSASAGARAVMEELGVPYELIETSIAYNNFEQTEAQDAELLALNPNGWIPVLITEHGAIYECGAIVTYLCDKHPETALAPAANDPERGLFLQWLFYFSSSIQNAFQMTYYPDRFCSSSDDETTVRRRAVTRLRELWQVVDDAIGDSEWVLGDRFSAVDIYMYMLTTWFKNEHNHPAVEEFPNINRVIKKVAQRPSVQRVYATG